MAGRKIDSADDGRACLEKVKKSGLTLAAWARQQGVDARSLYAWRYSLQPDRSSVPAAPALRMVELVPSTPSPMAPPITIRCGSFSIEVGRDLDDRLLARVLAVVASC